MGPIILCMAASSCIWSLSPESASAISRDWASQLQSTALPSLPLGTGEDGGGAQAEDAGGPVELVVLGELGGERRHLPAPLDGVEHALFPAQLPS